VPVVAFVLAIALTALFRARAPYIYSSSDAIRYIQEPFEGGRDVYVLRSHVCDLHFQQLWQQILDEVPEDSRDFIFILYDNTKDSMQPEFHAKNARHIIYHTEAECKARNSYHESNWSNVDAPISFIYDRVKDMTYSNVWLMEYDLCFDDSVLKCLKAAGRSEFDFMSSVIHHPDTDKGWVWWDSLKGEIANVPMSDRRGSFFPLVRISNRLLLAIHDNLNKSGGYCEVYVPTLANRLGMRCGAFNDLAIGDFGLDIVKTLPVNSSSRVYHKCLLVR
jgi:hypothetical protein